MPRVPRDSTPFRWTKAKHNAAQLLAADELTDQEIADQLDICRETLWTWKRRSVFLAKVKELTEQLGDVARRYAIGHRSRRVAALQRRWERMLQVIEERAAAPEMQNAPGGPSGVLARGLKSIGAGPAAEKVEEFTFDAALLKELREHEKQVAIELGQWTEKHEHSLSDAELNDAIRGELARLVQAGQGGNAGAAPEDAGAAAGAPVGDPVGETPSPHELPE